MVMVVGSVKVGIAMSTRSLSGARGRSTGTAGCGIVADSDPYEEWAETELARAKEQISARKLDEARMTLAQVVARTDPESELSAEAGRGTVAIYNIRRIAKAEGAEKDRLREQARRDLANTRWASLFE